MAKDGTFKSGNATGFSNCPRNIRVEWSIKQSVTDNSSTFYWKAFAENYGSSWVKAGPVMVVINNTTVLNITGRFQMSANQSLGSGSISIKHDSDGKKKINVSISAAIYSSSVNSTCADTITLDDIPRASSFGEIVGNMIGSRIAVNIERNSSSFTHQFWYKVGYSEWFNLGTGHGTYLEFTPPMDLCGQFPNESKGTMQLCIRTFHGTQRIGNDVYKNVTVYVPDTVKPTASLKMSDANGYFAMYGKYIQTKSAVHAVINASGAYGSTISSYKTEIDEKTYAKAEFTTDVIAGSGTLDIRVTVTDSRKRTVVIQQTIEVYEYKAPKITKVYAKRCQPDGTKHSSGAYLGVNFACEITPLEGKNTAKYNIYYKKNTEDVYSIMILSAYQNQYSVDDGRFVFAADKKSTYDIILRITDKFGTVEKQIYGPSVQPFLSRFRNGLGAAFGKLAELEGVFDIGFKTRFSGGLLRLVLDNGTDLNEMTIPNTYAGRDSSSAGYLNCPVSDGKFILLVESAGDSGEIFQRLTTCDKENSLTYERFFYDNEWSEWMSTKKKVVTAQVTRTITLPTNAYCQPYTHFQGGIAIPKENIEKYGEIVNVHAVNAAYVPIPVRFTKSDNTYSIASTTAGNTVYVIHAKLE